MDLQEKYDRAHSALEKIRDGVVQRNVTWTFRVDGVASKHDKCRHGLAMYEDCEGCVTEYIERILGEIDGSIV